MWVRENESLPIMRIQFYHAGSTITVQYCYVLHAALTAIHDQAGQQIKANVYPNPAKEFIFIDADTDLERVVLTDLAGRILYQAHVENHEAEIPVHDIKEGLYLVHYSDRQGNSGVTKIYR